MFKVGLDLPEVAREPAPTQQKKKNKKKDNAPLSGNDLQSMMDELKAEKRAPSESAPKAKKQRVEQVKEEKANKEASNVKNSQENIENKSENKEVLKKEPKQKQKQKQKQEPKQEKKQETKQNTKPEKPNESKPAPLPTTLKNGKKLTPLQLKMQQKLSGARFRWINEQLYTTDSQHAFDIFQKQPEVFKEYHDGFRHQVEQWPENPVISFAEQFEERTAKPVNAPGGLPGDKSQGGAGKVVVADMGCGEAELALKLQQFNQKMAKTKQGKRIPKFEVHSFDMHKGNDRITVADIANVPLPNNSVHVVVFCLALMGTNLADFVNEAIRVLNDNGLVWIAEIKSRFENNDYSQFVETLKDMGLYHKTTDDSNKMFVKFEFVKLPHKMARAKNTNPELTLKPCIYKRR